MEEGTAIASFKWSVCLYVQGWSRWQPLIGVSHISQCIALCLGRIANSCDQTAVALLLCANCRQLVVCLHVFMQGPGQG